MSSHRRADARRRPALLRTKVRDVLCCIDMRVGHAFLSRPMIVTLVILTCTGHQILARIRDIFKMLGTGMADEQAVTFIAKGRTLTLEEFEYAPES